MRQPKKHFVLELCLQVTIRELQSLSELEDELNVEEGIGVASLAFLGVGGSESNKGRLFIMPWGVRGPR